MRRGELTGKIQTVLGIIDADSLGATLPHEHLLIDSSSVYFVEPNEASEKKLAHESVKMDNLYWVKLHPLNHLDDLKLTDEQLAAKEALFYKWAGGSTIVELTCSYTLGRDPLGLARISRATGLNIVMGTGYYIALSHPSDTTTKTTEEITEEIVKDIVVGVGNSQVRAGIIGEIGCSTPLQETERKVLLASAEAQRQTGVALNIHPGFSDDSVLEIINILGDAGADLSHTVISHVDVWGFSRGTLCQLMDAGCFIEYDTFGHPGISAPFNGRYLDIPSDMQRINDIIELIAEGYLNQILVSHDICWKHQLVTYGGYGYGHILRYIVPVMQSKGISDEQIDTLLVENPKRLLTFTS
jgi:phosphotriesterase-related protein